MNANSLGKSMNAATAFHLSLGVPDLEASLRFFVGVLDARVTHHDPAYVNLALAGVQLTLTESRLRGELPDIHFGINLGVDAFLALAARVQSAARDCVVTAPHIVDPGTPMERHKMYLRCPAGYLVEIKGRDT